MEGFTKEEMENCFAAGVAFARDMFNNPSNPVYINTVIEGKNKSDTDTKGTWAFEISSGFDGYRCADCGTWAYAEGKRICKCDK